jgi:ornithine cyclodeaminase/alanine dehydrogenase-like protein (mu-crystallin family)
MLFIDNATVERVLTMKDCIEVQEQAFQQSLSGQSMQRGRLDFYAPCDREDGYYRWGTMEGVSHGVLAIRMKSDIVTWPRDESGRFTEDKYCVEPGTYCGLIFLLSTQNGEPLAIINDGYIQHMRVGGGAGIGVKLLSRENSSVVGMLGSGGMARTFIEAFLVVRPIKSVRVYSPTKDHREQFAREMSEKHGIEVCAVDSPEEAVRSVDILSTCTDSMTPTVKPEWLEPGMHLANLGPAEIDASVMAAIDIVIRQGTSGLRVVKNDRPLRALRRIPQITMISSAGASREGRLTIKLPSTTTWETRVCSFPPLGALCTRKRNSRGAAVTCQPSGFYRIFGTEPSLISPSNSPRFFVRYDGRLV